MWWFLQFFKIVIPIWGNDLILVSHPSPSPKEAFVFTTSQIERLHNIGMLTAQDCLAFVTWPCRDYNVAMHHFPALYRAAVSDLINEICACRFVVDAVLNCKTASCGLVCLASNNHRISGRPFRVRRPFGHEIRRNFANLNSEQAKQAS